MDSDERCGLNFGMSVLCTKPDTGSTCGGDSGGFLGVEENGRWVQYGITSFGPGDCEAKIFSAYADVLFLRPWIMEMANV